MLFNPATATYGLHVALPPGREKLATNPLPTGYRSATAMTGSPQSADINASLMRADGKCPRSASNFGQTLPIPVPLNSSANITKCVRGAPIMVRSASDRLHKKSIFCTKSSPLLGLHVRCCSRLSAKAQGFQWCRRVVVRPCFYFMSILPRRFYPNVALYCLAL